MIVADLAQIADSGADDGGPVTEDGALTHPDRMLTGAYHHPVLQDGRVVADAHRGAVRARDQALRQDRAGADVDLAEDYRGTGDLRLQLVDDHLVEAHGGLTVLKVMRLSSAPVWRTAAAACRDATRIGSHTGENGGA